VFLRTYVVVARRFAEVEAEMTSCAENWLPDMAKDANVDGERLLSELGFDLGWVSSTSAYCPLSF
jgi:hypothetical protein